MGSTVIPIAACELLAVTDTLHPPLLHIPDHSQLTLLLVGWSAWWSD